MRWTIFFPGFNFQNLMERSTGISLGCPADRKSCLLCFVHSLLILTQDKLVRVHASKTTVSCFGSNFLVVMTSNVDFHFHAVHAQRKAASFYGVIRV